jgi:hypothetical protein
MMYVQSVYDKEREATMQAATTVFGRVEHVGCYRLYIQPDGKLVLNTGNSKMSVTPEEARELLDYLLVFARFFQAEPVGVNGHVK